MEIINHIFMYLSSPTSKIIQQSSYFKRHLPFLLLATRRGYQLPRSRSSRECLADYQHDIYWRIGNHLHPEDNTRVELFFEHSNRNHVILFSENIGFDFTIFYERYMLSTSHYYIDTPPRHRLFSGCFNTIWVPPICNRYMDWVYNGIAFCMFRYFIPVLIVLWLCGLILYSLYYCTNEATASNAGRPLVAEDFFTSM